MARTTDWLPDTDAVRAAYLDHLAARWRTRQRGCHDDAQPSIPICRHPLRPRVDRGEFVNVAVVLHSQSADVLAIEAHVDEARLRSLHANVDVDG